MQTLLLSLSTSYFKSYSGLTKTAWRGILLNLFDSILIGIFYFLSTYFIKDLHLSITTTGYIISCYGIGAIAGGYLGGKLSDKFSSGIVVTLSLFIQAVGYLTLIKVKFIPLIMCTIFILGMSSYGFITSNYLWVLNRCNETQRLKALNLLATASNLGFGISSIFIGLVVTIGFQYIFLFSGIALFILSYISSKDKKTSPHIQNENETLNQSSKPLNFNGNKDRIILTIILICVFFTGTIVAQLSSTYSIYIQSSFPHLGITAVSILFTLNSLLVVLFEVPIGNILSNYNKILMVGIGSFFIGLGMFLLNVSFIFSIAILACIIYTLGEIIFFCLAQLICYQRGPKNKKGKYMGLYRMVYASSRVIGPAIGGIIYSDFGGNIIWYISGLIGITSLLTCFHFRKFD